MNAADSSWVSFLPVEITWEPSAVSRSSFTETPASLAALPHAFARPLPVLFAEVSL